MFVHDIRRYSEETVFIRLWTPLGENEFMERCAVGV